MWRAGWPRLLSIASLRMSISRVKAGYWRPSISIIWQSRNGNAQRGATFNIRIHPQRLETIKAARVYGGLKKRQSRQCPHNFLQPRRCPLAPETFISLAQLQYTDSNKISVPVSGK